MGVHASWGREEEGMLGMEGMQDFFFPRRIEALKARLRLNESVGEKEENGANQAAVFDPMERLIEVIIKTEDQNNDDGD